MLRSPLEEDASGGDQQQLDNSIINALTDAYPPGLHTPYFRTYQRINTHSNDQSGVVFERFQ